MNTQQVPEWFRTAILYQIYPQSFQDSNGDGIGDLPGITSRLDYIQNLGVTAIWLSPICDSPMLDAGYDVRDFCAVAERYGTTEDFKELCEQAHSRGMRVLLDFVPGHTSLDHPWFIASQKHEENEYTDRYIWTDSMYRSPQGKNGKEMRDLSGWGEREGRVATNFFSTQPKLNYGYVDPDPNQPYQQHYTAPGPQKLWAEMKDICRFWLNLGCDGFRIDSAKSLVIGDPRIGTAALYQDLRKMLDEEYPEAVVIGEWGWPCDADAAGLHGSMLLHNMKSWISLVAKPGWENYKQPPFLGDEGDITIFTQEYQMHYDQLTNKTHICIISCNHDYKRPATDRPVEQIYVLMALILTFPGTPIIYYGDEIGMTFMKGLASKEGGYRRTGSRTPMQWDTTAENCGFSTADAEALYLPVPETQQAPSVKSQDGKEGSLFEHVKILNQLRSKHPALAGDAEYQVLYAEKHQYPFVYKRACEQEQIIVALNPSSKTVQIALESQATQIKPIYISEADAKMIGGQLKLTCGPESWGLWKIH